MSCNTSWKAKGRYVQHLFFAQCYLANLTQSKEMPAFGEHSSLFLVLQLQASSGSIQTIAAGDSILAPIGRAWCHLPVEQSDLSHLAVLTLLVPGALPHEDDQHTQSELPLP